MLVTGLPTVVLLFPFGIAWFVLLTWYARGFRCPSCIQRFSGQRLSLLLGTRCKHCDLPVGALPGNREPLAA